MPAKIASFGSSSFFRAVSVPAQTSRRFAWAGRGTHTLHLGPLLGGLAITRVATGWEICAPRLGIAFISTERTLQEAKAKAVEAAVSALEQQAQDIQAALDHLRRT